MDELVPKMLGTPHGLRWLFDALAPDSRACTHTITPRPEDISQHYDCELSGHVNVDGAVQCYICGATDVAFAMHVESGPPTNVWKVEVRDAD